MGVGQCGPLGSASNSPAADSGTMCVSSSPTPGPTCNALDFYLNDETPIAVYMAAEMNANADSVDVKQSLGLEFGIKRQIRLPQFQPERRWSAGREEPIASTVTLNWRWSTVKEHSWQQIESTG